MPLPFHTIWLGGCPPLRAMENLAHLLDLSAADPDACRPLLWLDRSAWQAVLHEASLPLEACSRDTLPQGNFECRAIQALPTATPSHWLRIDGQGQVAHLPVLLLDELTATLAQLWQELDSALHHLQALGQKPAGQAFLEQELGLADPAAAALLHGPSLFAYLLSLLNHGRHHWASHGLLCLASDLLRLLALCWQPGAYGDLGDVAGRLRRLPDASDAGPSGFCAHHTVAIENDLIVATQRTTIQAITLATTLWSWRCVRGIASRLGISQPQLSPAEQLQAVLPHLDERLPPPASLQPLFQPPWTRLADFINLAYGAQPLFHPASTLAAYAAGRRGKELLINEVGGFTGYQKATHHLAPDNAASWARFAAGQQLLDYAPQLGWKTYGFGTIDRLIDLGRRLAAADPSAESARSDLGQLADSLSLGASQLDAIALLCHQLHELLSQAHHVPEQRGSCLARVERLCDQFQLGP